MYLRTFHTVVQLITAPYFKLTLLAREIFPPQKPYIDANHGSPCIMTQHETGNAQVLPSLTAPWLLSCDRIVKDIHVRSTNQFYNAAFLYNPLQNPFGEWRQYRVCVEENIS